MKNGTLFEKIAALPEGQRGQRQVIDRADTLLVISEYMREQPQYYILRRTVDGTAGHYEYLTLNYFQENLLPQSLFTDKAFLERVKEQNGGEILPVRLLVGGVANGNHAKEIEE